MKIRTLISTAVLLASAQLSQAVTVVWPGDAEVYDGPYNNFDTSTYDIESVADANTPAFVPFVADRLDNIVSPAYFHVWHAVETGEEYVDRTFTLDLRLDGEWTNIWSFTVVKEEIGLAVFDDDGNPVLDQDGFPLWQGIVSSPDGIGIDYALSSAETCNFPDYMPCYGNGGIDNISFARGEITGIRWDVSADVSFGYHGFSGSELNFSDTASAVPLPGAFFLYSSALLLLARRK